MSREKTEHLLSADNYFAQIPEWVMYAPISKSAILVYLVLQRYSNSVTHTCWPSRETIATRASITVSTVDKCLKELEAIGAIQIHRRKKGPGMNSSNLYKMISAMPEWAIKQMTDLDFDPQPNGATEISLDPQVSSPSEAKKSYTQTIEDNQRRGTRTKNTLTVSEQRMFDEFWAVYPKDEDEQPARAAFKKALKRASFEEIMEGARWYADYREGEDGQFTKIAKNWLRDDAWRNRPVKSKQRGNRRDEFDEMFYDAVEGYHGENALGFERKELGS